MSASSLEVAEFFCGIGGMHCALKESGLNYNVKFAVDINTVTNAIYRHNFPDTNLAQREIQSLTEEEMNKISFNTVVMSPPCQPFTRVGLKKDIEDVRTAAFFSLLSKFERLAKPISYIFVENVQGFETSATREELINFLNSNNYIHQEFLLTPLQFGIPNSRLRYYCMARHNTMGDFSFTHSTKVLFDVPEEVRHLLLPKKPYIDSAVISNCFNLSSADQLVNHQENVTKAIDSIREITPLADFMIEDDDNHDFILDSNAMKHYDGLDLRSPCSRNSSCFTKRYGHYFVGSGSFLQTGTNLDDGRHELRYFKPKEIANIMCFPSCFGFPDGTSLKQSYRALGNSVNVYVVANLLRIMTNGY